MNLAAWIGILIPFAGTALGAATVFLMRRGMSPFLERAATGFAAGVMVAASVWSLIIPAIDMAGERWGTWAFVPAAVGFWLGILMLLALDRLIPHLHLHAEEAEGPRAKLRRSTLLVLSVTLHNIPEGMAVGVLFAGLLAGSADITLAGAFALSVGIAIQNFPEGAIISMPLRAEGASRSKAFAYGALSGIVEPLGALLTIAAAALFVPILPFCLALSAGAMIYVVVEELIPETAAGGHSNVGTLFFAVGFTVMMILDVALGA